MNATEITVNHGTTPAALTTASAAAPARTGFRVRGQTNVASRIFSWVGARQRELSARVHAAADQRARLRGWQVTEGTGRFGFAGRLYRDPRFDDIRRGAAAGVRAADGHVRHDFIGGRTSNQGGQ